LEIDAGHQLFISSTIVKSESPCYSSYWHHVRPNIGSVVLAQFLLLTFVIFYNIATLFNTHLLSTYYAWNTCDINILYHNFCLHVNCNIAHYWSLTKEVRLS